jgi:hypothetical protein
MNTEQTVDTAKASTPSTASVLWSTHTCMVADADGNQVEVVVRCVDMRSLDDVLTFATEVMESLKWEKGMPTLDITNPLTILKLISQHRPAISALIPKLTDINPDVWATLRLDHAVTLCRKVFEVNQDFFTTNVLPSAGL